MFEIKVCTLDIKINQQTLFERKSIWSKNLVQKRNKKKANDCEKALYHHNQPEH